jgi:hypothetical protein
MLKKSRVQIAKRIEIVREEEYFGDHKQIRNRIWVSLFSFLSVRKSVILAPIPPQRLQCWLGPSQKIPIL